MIEHQPYLSFQRLVVTQQVKSTKLTLVLSIDVKPPLTCQCCYELQRSLLQYIFSLILCRRESNLLSAGMRWQNLNCKIVPCIILSLQPLSERLCCASYSLFKDWE